MAKEYDVQMNIRVPERLKRAYVRASKREGMSLAAWVRKWLGEGVELTAGLRPPRRKGGGR
jgi:predicted HicB family RNase H-like nuclease